MVSYGRIIKRFAGVATNAGQLGAPLSKPRIFFGYVYTILNTGIISELLSILI